MTYSDKPTRKSNGQYEFKRMDHPNGVKIKVHTDLVKLVFHMWKADIRSLPISQGMCSFNCRHKDIFRGNESFFKETKYCYTHVGFKFNTAQDFEKFLNIVALYSDDDDSMYSRIMGYDTSNKDSWAMKAHAYNNGEVIQWKRPTYAPGKRYTYDVAVVESCYENDFVVRPHLTFPRKHLTYVEDKVIDSLIKRI